MGSTKVAIDENNQHQEGRERGNIVFINKATKQTTAYCTSHDTQPTLELLTPVSLSGTLGTLGPSHLQSRHFPRVPKCSRALAFLHKLPPGPGHANMLTP